MTALALLADALNRDHPALIFCTSLIQSMPAGVDYGWLEVKCRRCETRASLPLYAIRRPRDTPIWKLEAALKCRSCRTARYSPPVHMIKLTQQREITPYAWVHPDDDDRR